ncbi:cellulose biosynthesis protein BcsQ [Gibbsiella greigii]
MPVIALQGIRGGIGTTSVTAALAWALRQLGESVLVIDFSPDNLLRLHFNTPLALARGWARAQLDGEDWRQAALRYCEGLDFLPFGQLTEQETSEVCRQNPEQSPAWPLRLAELKAAGRYRWILLDIPAGNDVQALLPLADSVFVLLNPDANSHVRLHRHTPLPHSHFLINRYSSASQIQQDLHQLWLNTLPALLPVVIHRDEALAEALLMKQPLGEYRPESLAADEVLTLANWCLLHLNKAAL